VPEPEDGACTRPSGQVEGLHIPYTDTGAIMNPIFEENGQWFFWDETWSDPYGPYASRKEAVEALRKYIDYL
jgi:ABC-type ATPase with predicted acetyltransferase domain